MKAACWYGIHDMRVVDVPEPTILNPRDAILRVTLTAICGSDLHMYDGNIVPMRAGDIVGHEFMGEVVAVGPGVTNLKVGERVVVPFPIACGGCRHCKEEEYSLCDNSNPNAFLAEKMFGYAPSGIFGYSHLTGGYAGGHAEYVRVPFADVGPLKVPPHLTDEQVLFLSDILPTGYQAALFAEIKPGDTVAVWGCGPVGQFTIQCARLLGAERVVAIDTVPERLGMAATVSGAEILDYSRVDVLDALRDMTDGTGPDACIDAVGMEAHGMGVAALYDHVKQVTRMQTDRPTALREVIMACRKGGTVSIPGVYAGFADKIPLGAAFNKGLTFRMGQTHVHRYMPLLLDHIEQGRLQPERIITHRLRLDDAPSAYRDFRAKRDGCIKVVMKPDTIPSSP